MSSIIQVENLSKSFTLHHEGKERYTALRDVVAGKAKKIFSFPKRLMTDVSRPTTEEFWALKDVSFNIEQGDRVGIIGRNGAGKSTLLKILSRITEPTKGSIKIRGRVASLLEVGTGFHPELTGRENIFLNGAILGMSRAEIKKKFDEIIDFAEVEKFLDTPVKRYSSGMYVRLAFAVAAHLEPEILVVDEVLAVGDAQFQKKCLGKMEEVSNKGGRTVFFVSHNINAITTLCKTAILLENGTLKCVDSTSRILPLYFENKRNKLLRTVIIDKLDDPGNNLWPCGKPLKLKVSIDRTQLPVACVCDLAFYTYEGIKVFALQSDKLLGGKTFSEVIESIVFEIENVGLVERDLRIDVGLRNGINEAYSYLEENAFSVSVTSENITKYKVKDAVVAPKSKIVLSYE